MKKEIKKTFTYSGKPSVHKKSMKKAKSEGFTFSEKVEELLESYNTDTVCKSVHGGIPIPAGYIEIRDIAVLKSSGKIEKLK